MKAKYAGDCWRCGGPIWQRCGTCKWEGSAYPPATTCPECGSDALRDDHVGRATKTTPEQ